MPSYYIFFANGKRGKITGYALSILIGINWGGIHILRGNKLHIYILVAYLYLSWIVIMNCLICISRLKFAIIKKGEIVGNTFSRHYTKRVFIFVGFDEWQTMRKLTYDEVQAQAQNWYITRFKHKTKIEIKFYMSRYLIVILIRQLKLKTWLLS